MPFKSLCSALSFILLFGCGSSDQDSSESSSQIEQTTIADIEEGIRAHIEQKTKASGGYFPLPHEGGNMELKLVRVHTEYLSNLGPGRHFACVDLADEKGDVYDVDFFLEGKPGAMKVTETTVHKENGKPLYTWKQRKDKTWERVPVDLANNRLMGVMEGEDAFSFEYRVILPEIIDSGKIWIPVAQSDSFQTVELTSLFPADRGEFKSDEKYGNRYLFMALDQSDSGKEIRLKYQVRRREKGPYADPDTNPSDYLGSTALLPTGGRFSKIVDQVLEGKKNDSKLMQARAIYDFIIDTVRYRKAGQYGTGDANYACDARSGNCTEFHSYFISLARSAGIPSRFAIGASIPSERNEGGVNGYHCWAEFHAYGKWWPVDISEANKYSALATYYFGHHPANRLELSKGRDIPLSPRPVSGSVPFFAYPVVEVNGIPASAETVFEFSRKVDNLPS
jgi:hypothetical protein